LMRSPLVALCLLLACRPETPASTDAAPPPATPRAQYPLDRIPPAPRPGDPIRDPEVPARLMKSADPVYPEEARRRGITGMVILEIVIETDGHVSAGRVHKPLPFGLTQSAIDAVGKWRYSPAMDRGRPVRSLQQVTVKFNPEVSR